MSLDSFKCRKTLTVGTKTYHYFSLKVAEKNGLKGISQLPYSMKVLVENLLRFEEAARSPRPTSRVAPHGWSIAARVASRKSPSVPRAC